MANSIMTLTRFLISLRVFSFVFEKKPNPGCRYLLLPTLTLESTLFPLTILLLGKWKILSFEVDIVPVNTMAQTLYSSWGSN